MKYLPLILLLLPCFINAQDYEPIKHTRGGTYLALDSLSDIMINSLPRIRACKGTFGEEALEYNEQRAFEKLIADAIKKIPAFPDTCDIYSYSLRAEVNCKGEIGNWDAAFELGSNIILPYQALFLNKLAEALRQVTYFKSTIDESLGEHIIRVSMNKGKISVVY